jgi:PIN domain nuclease of toxin-antitoxin system
MSSFVVDTSAVIASIQEEPGGEALLDDSVEWILSSVSFAEVIGVLMRKGFSRREACETMDAFDARIVEFDRALAEEAGAMIMHTRSFGLSLGDRACLALAAREKLPALTADRAWQGVQVGVQIQFIR